MRSSTDTTPHSQRLAQSEKATSMDIPPSTNLTITLRLAQHSQSRKPKPYRAVQRLDGVVVAYPLFRPSTPPEFEPRIPVFTVPEPNSRETKNKGKGKDEKRTRCGRGGYNSPKKDNVMMQRWLEEEGPWCGLVVVSDQAES